MNHHPSRLSLPRAPRRLPPPQDETATPIKQDTKKGALRFYPYNINWCAQGCRQTTLFSAGFFVWLVACAGRAALLPTPTTPAGAPGCSDPEPAGLPACPDSSSCAPGRRPCRAAPRRSCRAGAGLNSRGCARPLARAAVPYPTRSWPYPQELRPAAPDLGGPGAQEHRVRRRGEHCASRLLPALLPSRCTLALALLSRSLPPRRWPPRRWPRVARLHRGLHPPDERNTIHTFNTWTDCSVLTHWYSASLRGFFC